MIDASTFDLYMLVHYSVIYIALFLHHHPYDYHLHNVASNVCFLVIHHNIVYFKNPIEPCLNIVFCDCLVLDKMTCNFSLLSGQNLDLLDKMDHGTLLVGTVIEILSLSDKFDNCFDFYSLCFYVF